MHIKKKGTIQQCLWSMESRKEHVEDNYLIARLAAKDGKQEVCYWCFRVCLVGMIRIQLLNKHIISPSVIFF